MSPADTIAREVRKIVASELARTEGRREPLYSTLIGIVEIPLIEAVLRHYGGNQSHAALALGISRNTLRKKTKEHGIHGR